MIKVRNLSFSFQPGSVNETKALSVINLDIHEGEFVVIIGANGSGKSTLLNLLAGTYTPDVGSIHIGEKDISHKSEYHRSRWISRLFQNPLAGTAPELSILENLRLASLRSGRKGLKIGTGKTFRSAAEKQIEQLELGLEQRLDQPVGLLSGGQRQALTLLMAVMDKSKLLLLDEPTAALDPKTSALFMKLCSKIIEESGLTAILVTHHMNHAIKFGHRLIQMQQGTIVRDLQGNEKSGLSVNELLSWFNV